MVQRPPRPRSPRWPRGGRDGGYREDVHVAIVGAGRLGRSFAALLPRVGHEITLVRRGEACPAVDLVLLAVPDAAVRSAAAGIPEGPVLLHTSGALEVDVLRPRA